MGNNKLGTNELLSELLHCCNKLLEQEPECLPTITLRSLIYNYTKQTHNAIRDITTVILARPNDTSAYYIRSSCFLINKEYDLAKRDFLRALKLQFAASNPNFVKGYTEEEISNATILNDEELYDMQKVVNHEVTTLLVNYVPSLGD